MATRIASLLLVLAFSAGAAAQSWRTARTPWGDPDLQGTFVNDNEYATPLERPDAFAGRTRDAVRPDEYKHTFHLGTDPAVEVDGHLFVDPNEDALKKILDLK